VVPIAIHLTVGAFDPWWEDNPEDASARANYYIVETIPHFYIDGTWYNGARERGAFQNAIENRGREDSPMEIDLIGTLLDDELSISVDVTSDEDFNSLYLYVALTEDYVEYAGLNDQQDHYDAMVKMMPNGNGTLFSIEADETLEFDFDQDMDGLGWHELEEDNLLLVCWVQDDHQEVIQAQNYSFQFGYPHVFMTEWSIDDEVGGNGNGRAEPGETVDVIITLEVPEGYLGAESVEAHLTCEDEDIEILEADFEHGALMDGEETSNSESPFRFRVSEDFIVHPVTLNLTVMAQPDDWEIDYELELMIGWPPFLLIDVAENDGATEVMQGSFGNEFAAYADHINLAEEFSLPAGLLDHYQAAIWYSFNNIETIYLDFEVNALTEYLDNGGNLILTGPYTCVDYGNSNFFRDYLGAELAEENVNGRYIEGYDDNEFFRGTNALLLRGDGAGAPNIRPSLTAIGDAVPVLYHSYNDEDMGVAGIVNETDTYKTLLLSFPIESIGGVGGTDERYEFLQRIADWLDIFQGISNGFEDQPCTFSLDPAYPNPFNSTSVIPFSLDRAGRFTLGVYDLTGREVVRLGSGVLPAGNHRAVLDASANNLSTGLYYVKLTGTGQAQILKVIYMR